MASQVVVSTFLLGLSVWRIEVILVGMPMEEHEFRPQNLNRSLYVFEWLSLAYIFVSLILVRLLAEDDLTGKLLERITRKEAVGAPGRNFYTLRWGIFMLEVLLFCSIDTGTCARS